MQAKKSPKGKKIYPNAEAPVLIKKAKKLGWTQDQLAAHIKITQQAVSDYSFGYIGRERHDVIKKLDEIVRGDLKPPDSARSLEPPSPEEVTERAIHPIGERNNRSSAQNVSKTAREGTSPYRGNVSPSGNRRSKR